MSKTTSVGLCCLPALLALSVAGCGGSEGDFAPVKGTITLDGEPLDGAKVEFDIDTGELAYGRSLGSTAYGLTDANGRYELKTTHKQEGALVGKHIVRITTRRMTVDAEGKEVLNPERLPPKFNLSSELTAEVTSGSNTIDFDLNLESSAGGQG
jgi:hypothetical protein